MALTLRIENQTSLPDGGPLSISIEGKRGIDIGRNQYLDWTLPDSSRLISGKHCEVRWRDGGYWLHDISANGTFLQGDDNRLKAPHRLRNGDRFAVGHYIIAVELDQEIISPTTPSSSVPAPDYAAIWNPNEDIPAPIDPKELKGSNDLRPLQPDFLDWAVDVPPANSPPAFDPQSAPLRSEAAHVVAQLDESWSSGASKVRSAEPVPNPAPNPRRPLPSPPGANVWAAEAAPADNSLPSRFETSSGNRGGLPPAIPAKPSAFERPEKQGAEQPDREAAREYPAAMAGAVGADFNRMFARGAGLADNPFGSRDPAEFAEQLGQLTILVLENMRQLLDARQQAKRFVRSADQTTIQAFDNNPLKFAPTAEDAMRIMFGSKNRGYLDAHGAVIQAFDDVKRHQVKTYAAMQQALKLMLEEFDPAKIETKSQADRGLVAMVSSNKARLWDTYVAQWQARTQHQNDGMLKVFMDYFAECYDRVGNDVG
ncbi:type VI secretion system-associated FHA domain protein TagH [Bradyrhizobium sp. JYMT SZCCT0428]|uniref:type VI secretion system-associated FHA domain protein TagH n=1 Tax=Bradyrhizobium sp. JYMT SZCCT0428 TaxID=2807673 RepID=UPI001BA5A8C5|nr:type VI secretion system-associated FHA domain protein TagH [Bradyrhizobium sp. JYMT SZCCT0428]MBR1155209.1 type VI secretion system-associated FHA domain protein TagH [Bradyrhizobium sp. JYMT SZCCT0428]